MDTKDYIKIFEQSSELLVVIDTNFAIVAASDAFLKTTVTARENIVGRDIFKVFPDNPDDKTANGESIIRASFNWVIKNKTKDTLPVVKYDIPKPESEGGRYELKYWQASSSPILDENNNVKYIIHRTEDVTENKILITQLEFDKKALKLLEDSENRHNMMLMKSPFACAVLKGKNMVISLANDKMKATWGKGNNVEGKPLIEVLSELKDTQFPNLLDEVYKTGIPYHANEVLAPKYINEQKEDVYYNFVYQPYREADETISGVTIIAAEVTAAVKVKKALEAQHEVEQKAMKHIEDSEKRYNMMLMKSPFAFAILKGKNMVITLANDSVKEMWGKGKDLEGKPILEVLPEIKDSEFPGLLDNVYTTGTPFSGEELLAPVFRNGKLEDVYFNFVYQPYLEADETISGVTVIAYEVTASVIVKKALAEQREVEQKAFKSIEESNTRYHTMFMESPFAFSVMKGKDMVITLANSLIKEFWGKGKDVEGKTLLEVLPEIKDQPFPEMIEKVYKTGIPVYANEILGKITYNGQLVHKYFNVVFQPYYEADNSISGVTQIAYEVTEMVMARKKIEESDKRYNMMLMHSPFTFVVLKGKDLVIALANDRIKEVWGKGNDVEGKSLLNLMPELSDTPFPALMDEVIATGIPYHGREVQNPHNVHGHEREEYFNFVFQPYWEADETVSGITIIGYDVTEQVIAKRKIEESEQRFRNLIYTSPSAIGILLGEDMVITIANEPIIEIWGKGKEIIGKKYFEALPELAEQGYKEVFNQVYKTGIPFNAFETPVNILQNGVTTLKYYNFILYPQKNINGEINGIGTIATEVTSKAKYNLQIKESEERFRLLVKQAPVSICVLRGEDFIIETMNQEMANFLDRKIEDSLNKPLFDVITEVKDQVYKGLLDTVYNTGSRFVSQELPLTINRNSKLEDVFVKFVYEPLREVDGTVTGVMVLADEITDQVNARKAIEVSEKKFRLLTNNMPQKITNADAEGNVTFFNQQWLDDTGLTFEELKDWGWEKAMHPDDLELTLTNWKHAVATGDIFDMECRIQSKEGGYRWYLSRAVPVKDETGKTIMWVGSNTDIHELKEAKSKAETAMQTAESAVKAKQEFLSNMSHEIRTPMNAIIGFTNVVLKTELSEKQKEYINAIKISGDALIVLINDILDIAKVDAGKMTFEQIPFDLSTSISATLHLFEPKIQEKNLELIEYYDVAIPKILLGDSLRLRQIILNLLSNAVKFTDEGKITVSVRMLKEEADSISIEFSVTDTGIGIPENKLEHIFDDFQQATDKTSRLHGGTGLGLSIVKKFVTLQGGTHFVNSKHGKGSTFGFILNFKKAIAEIAEISRTDIGVALAERIENKRILVVEDVPLNQLLIKIILIDFGFEVDIADNGRIAIEKLQENKYDIILMDLQMPELNGYEATEHIRNKMNSQIPIIALSADVTTVDIGKCEAVGMNDYISKPIDEKLLYSKIIKYLK